MALIEVRNLSFTYKNGNSRAVNDISFDIEKGEIFGFLGPSGAGKSTTQKILIRILTGYRGQVAVMGKSLDSWGGDFFEHTGVCFELPNHYQKLTARENLVFFRSLYAAETEEPGRLLEMVGLSQDADKPVSQFSKGMQMRLNFARSLLNRPELIFLDEPTTGMDPVNARKIKNMIRQLKSEGRTIFLTTHNMSVADELCDRVAFIIDGEITLVNSPRQLKIDHGQRRVKVEYHLNSHTESIEFPLEGLERNREFFNLLRSRQVETIHTQEATLEDIFIRVTGRSLI
jgi:fluoroquinolone transport system ATP-binding protein